MNIFIPFSWRKQNLDERKKDNSKSVPQDIWMPSRRKITKAEKIEKSITQFGK